MNIIGSLLDRLNTDDDERTEEEILAEEKAERIAFHRKHVRNGPTNFRTVTAGQVRRAEARSRRAEGRKVSRRYRRAWMQTQMAQAVLRGQLQQAGVLALHDGSFAEPSPLVVKTLEKDHGSVAKAKEVWDEIQRKRLAEQKAAIAKAVRDQQPKSLGHTTPEGAAQSAGFMA